MGFFEDHLNRLGRRLDACLGDLRWFWQRRSAGSSSGGGIGRDVRDRVEHAMGQARRAAGDARRAWEFQPDRVRARWTVLASFAAGAGVVLMVWTGVRLWRGPSTGLSPEDAAVLKAVQEKVKNNSIGGTGAALFPGAR